MTCKNLDFMKQTVKDQVKADLGSTPRTLSPWAERRVSQEKRFFGLWPQNDTIGQFVRNGICPDMSDRVSPDFYNFSLQGCTSAPLRMDRPKNPT